MFAAILKRNDAHDKLGRFATSASSGGTALSKHYDKYDDKTITVNTLLSEITKAERGEITLATIKSQNAPTSKEQYTDKNGGDYTEERKKLHFAIVSEILSAKNIAAATPKKGEKPTFVVLGGRGGSGKSKFTDGTLKEIDSSKFLILDSDEIKKKLKPPYAGWNAFSVHEESSHIFDAISEAAVDMGLNLLHDATLKTDHVMETIKAVKDKGYKVEGHYMFVPRQEAARRAIKRYLSKGPEERGRLVPSSVILENTRNEANFESLTKHFDKWSAYDNQGSAPKLVSRGAKK